MPCRIRAVSSATLVNLLEAPVQDESPHVEIRDGTKLMLVIQPFQILSVAVRFADV
jgi:hypothetical protein